MKFIQKFVELCRDENGATTIEYMLLATLVVGAAGTAVGLVTAEIGSYSF